MSEQWRPVLGYEEHYSASNFGNVKRVQTRSGSPSGRPLKTGSRRDYANYTLSLDNVQKTFCAHRLVWEAFHGPIPVGLQINHKNGDKRDNRLDNLEVCTASENMVHAYRTLGRDPSRPQRGEKNGRAKLKTADIAEIKRLRALGWSQQRIADQFCVNQTLISGILRGQFWREAA